MKKLFLLVLMTAFFATGNVMAQTAGKTCTKAQKASCAKTCTKAQKAACTGTKLAKTDASQAQLVNYVELEKQGYATRSCNVSGTKYATKTCSSTGNVTAFETCGKSGKTVKTVTCGKSGKVLLTETVNELQEGEGVVKEAKVKGTAVMPAAKGKACSGSKKPGCCKSKAAKAKTTDL